MTGYKTLFLFSLFTFSSSNAFLSNPNTENSRRLPTATTRMVRKRNRTQRSAVTPIDGADWPDRFPAKDHCSRCGLCETTYVSKVMDACAFLGDGMARIDRLEEQVHGRRRRTNDMVWSNQSSGIIADDEGRFGVLHEPIKLAQGVGMANKAQWTGCVTGIAVSMLESNMVDAVVCIASSDNNNGWASPQPIIAKTPGDVLRGRGVKPALAPSLKVLDEIQKDESIKKLLFCGVGCAVQAFRAIQSDLGLEEVFVLGTNCADNSPTPEAANDFIQKGIQIDGSKVLGYEFMQDFRVHVKTTDSYVTKPYFTLPGTIAEPSIATSCLACFDYTNGLADVVVGYMGAPLKPKARMDESYQTLTIRNPRGARMVQAAIESSRLVVGKEALGEGNHEMLASATVAGDSIVMSMLGVPPKESGMPSLLGEVMAFVIQKFGPKGTNFARYSIDYHILRNYLHVLDEWGEDRTKESLPKYALDIVNYYLNTDKKMKELASQINMKKESKQ
eukprot:scaffold368_cov125-Cylindrotheca_fusiformis.AAC.8